MAGFAFIDKVPDEKNCSYYADAPKKNTNGSHGLTSLSTVKIIMNNIIQEYTPPNNIQSGKTFVVTNLPNTVVTNIAVSMLINILAQFSRCLLSKSTLKQYHEILTNHTIL